MAKNIVNELFKFLREDVQESQLFEADKKYKTVKTSIVDLGEGKVPTDAATNPEGYMGELLEAVLKQPLDMFSAANAKKTFPAGTQVNVKASRDTSTGETHLLITTQDGVTYTKMIPEAQKETYLQEAVKEEKAEGEVAPAPMTDDNKDSKVEKDLDKETPEIKKEKELENDTKPEAPKKTAEGKVPADPSKVDATTAKDIKEEEKKEKQLTAVSDETTAKDLAAKYSGGRVVPDQTGKQFIIMVPESTVVEDIEEVSATKSATEPIVGGTEKDDKPGKNKEEDIPAAPKAEIKAEDTTTVTVKTKDKEVAVTTSDDGTDVQTKDTHGGEFPMHGPIDDWSPEWSLESVQDIAERLAVVEYLEETKKELSDKEKLFIKSVKGVKIPERNKKAVEEAVKKIKQLK